jgi:hypothetical protein
LEQVVREQFSKEKKRAAWGLGCCSEMKIAFANSSATFEFENQV